MVSLTLTLIPFIFHGAQVVRGDFIIFFNQIFDALCKLSADSDANVQSAAHLLDRLVKVYKQFKLPHSHLSTENNLISTSEDQPFPLCYHQHMHFLCSIHNSFLYTEAGYCY